jgi:hypothetical protein
MSERKEEEKVATTFFFPFKKKVTCSYLHIVCLIKQSNSRRISLPVVELSWQVLPLTLVILVTIQVSGSFSAANHHFQMGKGLTR